MVYLMAYIADMGTIRINDVFFDNGVGDGAFALYYAEKLPEGFRKISGVFFDLRNGRQLKVNIADTGDGGAEIFEERHLASVLTLAVNNEGDFCLVGI